MNQELHAAFIAHMKKTGLSQSQLARAVTVSPASINMYVRGTYAEHGGKLETIERKIAAYLEREAAKAERSDLIVGFVPTRTAMRIHEAMHDAHADGEITVIYGQAGLGKTVSVKEYCRNNEGAVLIEANPTFQMTVMLRKLAEAVRVSSQGTTHEVYEALCNRLQDSGRVIVVDEAENLPLRALEMLRRLHDETGVGLVLAGMPRLMFNLRGKRGELVQLYSRVSLALNLGDTLPEDELELIARHALPDADDDTVAMLVKESGGNTRRLQKLMRGTVRTAEKNDIAISPGIVKKYSKVIIR